MHLLTYFYTLVMIIWKYDNTMLSKRNGKVRMTLNFFWNMTFLVQRKSQNGNFSYKFHNMTKNLSYPYRTSSKCYFLINAPIEYTFQIQVVLMMHIFIFHETHSFQDFWTTTWTSYWLPNSYQSYDPQEKLSGLSSLEGFFCKNPVSKRPHSSSQWPNL